ncbi:MAG: hypothetical protein MGU50_23250 [Trichodesmium sp. MAG_R02]|jgi:hypothetical protein|nr:hypothetical protein [Trichodesmium sp. MAG_R02]
MYLSVLHAGSAECGFNPSLLPSKTTPESDSRIQQFRQELTIKCPDTKERLFS